MDWKKSRKKSFANINMLFNGRNDAIKFMEDYSSMILEAKRKAIEGKGLKILTPKQILQRLSIALAEVVMDLRKNFNSASSFN